jgi:hypothetical protein
MGTIDLNTTARTWRFMVENNQALLMRKSGHDAAWWAERGRAAGLANDAELRACMRDQHGITGYAQYAVSGEMFGYPDVMLSDADELFEAQYANLPELRPIADALLAWAAATGGVNIQLRKGYVSLHSPRRKFAQITRTTNSCVDVTLRIDAPAAGQLEEVKVREGDVFTRRLRLRADTPLKPDVLAFLAQALDQNS